VLQACKLGGKDIQMLMSARDGTLAGVASQLWTLPCHA
jgi:hypothetical protein